jgi:hypothetical protein
MALNKQNLSISFSKGVDTKTDSKQVVPGKLINLENVVLKKVGKFVKRFGYGVIANAQGINKGNAVSTFKNELVAFDGSAIHSYSSSDDKLYSKGVKIAVDISTQSIARNSYEQTNPDCAFHSNGISVYAWQDSSGGVRYSVFDVATQQTIVSNGLVDATGIKPKVKTIGNYVLIFFIDGTELKYFPILANNPSVIPTAVVVQAGVSSFYDVSFFNSLVYVAYSTGTTTGIFTLSSSLVKSTPIVVSAASSCLGIFNDAVNSTVWVVYNEGVTAKYFIYNYALTSQILAPTLIRTGVAAFPNITGFASAGNGYVFIEVSEASPSDSSVRIANVTSAGVVNSDIVFLRSVGLYSKPFKNSAGDNLITVTHESELQPTYFVANLSGKIVCKLAPATGGGLSTTGLLAEVNQVSTDNFIMAYEFKDFVQSVGGDVTTQTGINSVNLKFGEPILTEEIGNNLHASGGIISSYDSQNINELGFNLYPENVDYQAFVNGGGLKQGAYQYVAVYEWTDSQGQIHRSAPSVPLDVDTTLSVEYYQGATGSGTSFNDPVSGPYVTANFIAFGMSISGPGIPGPSYINQNSSPVATLSIIPYGTGAGSGTYKFSPGDGFKGSSTIGSNVIVLQKPQEEKIPADFVSGSTILYLKNDYQIPVGSFVYFQDVTTGSIVYSFVMNCQNRQVTLGVPTGYSSVGFVSSFPYNYEGVYVPFFKSIPLSTGGGYTNGNPTMTGVSNTNYIFVGEEYFGSFSGGSATVLSKTTNTITFNKNFTASYTAPSATVVLFCVLPYRYPSEASVYTEYNNTGTNAFNTITITKVNNDGTVEVDKVAASSRTDSTFITTSSVAATIEIPTLRITEKEDARISLYRTEVNGTVFYRVDDLNNPIINNKTTDSVSYSDTLTDEVLIGNEQLYTTGGEVENIAPPASNLIGQYKNRLLAVPNEDPLSFWYSKQVRANTPIEFNDSFVQRVPEKGGAITALQQMDDKLIIFKQDYVFVMVGDGPSVSGINNDFTDPQLITADAGCSDKKSVVVLPTGVIYKSQKGFYLLDRSLNVRYIGADVEAYNSYTVTSATMNETENQVRFTISSGDCLVYDYYVEQWAVFKGINANDAVTFQDKYTYIVPSGQIRKENAQFTDNNSFIPMVIETGWLNLAGLQNFQRIYHIMLVGTYKSPHTLQIDLYRDFNETAYDTITIPVLTAPDKYQYRIFPSIQKCEAIKIKITELQSSPYGEGFDISAINIELGVKRGQNKLAPGESYG